jgi:hypothetical protein
MASATEVTFALDHCPSDGWTDPRSIKDYRVVYPGVSNVHERYELSNNDPHNPQADLLLGGGGGCERPVQ